MRAIFQLQHSFDQVHPESILGWLHNKEVEVISFLPSPMGNRLGPQIDDDLVVFDYEIIPLENAELPYIGNEFWFSAHGSDPERCIVMRKYENPQIGLGYDFAIRLQGGSAMAAYTHELTPV